MSDFFSDRSESEIDKNGLSTRYSQPVTHASTNRARRCLTSQIGRDGVCSAWYGPSPPAATLYQQLYARRSCKSRLRASQAGSAISSGWRGKYVTRCRPSRNGDSFRSSRIGKQLLTLLKSVAVGINSDVSIETLRSTSNSLPYSILRLTNRAEVTVSKRGLSIPSLLRRARSAATPAGG